MSDNASHEQPGAHHLSSAAPRTLLSAVVTGTLALAYGVAGAETNPCASISDSAARLSCYDRTYGGTGSAGVSAPSSMAGAAAAGEQGAAARAAAPANTAAPVPAIKSPAQQVEEFGLTEEAVRKQAEAALPKSEPRPEVVTSIESTVATVNRRSTGQLVLKLANGQVWTQIESDARIYVKAGERVTIRKAILGSYTLATDHGSFKVKRVQ